MNTYLKKADTEARLASEKTKLELEKKAAKEQAEFEKTLKKNWSDKNIAGVTIFTDKKTKKSWTEFMGSANWINATLKCRKSGMKLPTSSQLVAAIENGFMSFIENPLGMLWTAEDKSNISDAQFSITMENHEALAVANSGQVVPESKLEDLGIVCIK